MQKWITTAGVAQIVVPPNEPVFLPVPPVAQQAQMIVMNNEQFDRLIEGIQNCSSGIQLLVDKAH